MTSEAQIAYLNLTVKCKLAASPIHGLGAFALRDIATGEKCYLVPPFFEKKTPAQWFTLSYKELEQLQPEIRELILQRWPAVLNGSHFISPNDMMWLCTFVNHSSEHPNYDIDSDCATRLVQKGEELTQDYTRMTNAKELYPFL